jgi:hypothetical protein
MTEAEKSSSLTVTMSEILRCYSQCKSSYKRARPHVCGYIASDPLVKAQIAKNEAANRPWDSSLRCSLEVGCLVSDEKTFKRSSKIETRRVLAEAKAKPYYF